VVEAIPTNKPKGMSDHGPVLNQAIEYGSNAQSAIISAFQLSAIFAKPSTATATPTANPHSRQALTAFPRARSSEASDAGPCTGSIARAGPASETLPESGLSSSRHSIRRSRSHSAPSSDHSAEPTLL
jgi:hypothetical protein